eukprot:7892458-Pyramimonas_sp.AAC.1
MELGRFKGMGDSTAIRALSERLWLPEPGAGWEPPGDDLLAHAQRIKGYEEGMPFAVPDLYADGAFIDGGAQIACAGCAVVALPPCGNSVDPGSGSAARALASPLAGPLQSTGGSELLALLLLVKFSLPAVTAHFDAAFAVDGTNARGPEGTTSSKPAWAEIWVR